jgi:hypothetical protein
MTVASEQLWETFSGPLHQFIRRRVPDRASRHHDGGHKRTRHRKADGCAERRSERLLWFIREQLLRLSGLVSEPP